jgi:galactitol-specific phosphotransferase system IIC component
MAANNGWFKLTLPNLLVGLGVALVVPVLLPAAGAVLRPLAKGAVKAGLTVYDTLTGFVAESGEQVSDLMAEARAEHYTDPKK